MKNIRRVCQHCGFYESAHYPVNYADGPHVSGVTLVCPSGTFLATSEPALSSDARILKPEGSQATGSATQGLSSLDRIVRSPTETGE